MKIKNIQIKLDKNFILMALLLIAVFLMGMLVNKINFLSKNSGQSQALTQVQDKAKKDTQNLVNIENKVISKNGFRLKLSWNTLGKQMVADGVIDLAKLSQSLTSKDQLTPDLAKYFDGSNQAITINSQNSHFWLNVLWGLGLANQNALLDSGDMQTGGTPGNFASTGGYTLGQGDAMTHYSKHSYIQLSDAQQKTVEKIASGIYRPCCGNSAAFPDCNHGMAMLGLIELMVSQNASEQDIYNAALAVNEYWFPQTYFSIAYHFEKLGKDYSKIPAQEILSSVYSSAEGNKKVQQETLGVTWPSQATGEGCGA
jgi:hypothetical protein